VPDAVVTPDGKLLVADSGHNRVLVWNQIPLTSGQPADLVLGQPDFTSCDANAPMSQGGASLVSNRSLAAPVGLWTDGTRLVVIDAGNHRALIWNSFPRSNFQPADLVLGQPDFTTALTVSTPTDATVRKRKKRQAAISTGDTVTRLWIAS
jgi:DNA-binding beta-propeller fold protein YncE